VVPPYRLIRHVNSFLTIRNDVGCLPVVRARMVSQGRPLPQRVSSAGHMCRVAIIIAGSLAVAGCSALAPGDWLPSMSLGGGAGYPLKLESDPPGADARTSPGPACRTPCTVTVPARDDLTVTFALTGYETQTMPVSLQRADVLGSEFTTAVQFAPNPVVAQLEPAPPPVAGKKSAKPKPPRRPRARRKRSGSARRRLRAPRRPVPRRHNARLLARNRPHQPLPGLPRAEIMARYRRAPIWSVVKTARGHCLTAFSRAA
jgi:hypothetical protein